MEKLLGHGNGGDVGVDALIPVEEALHVDGLADLQSLHRRVHIGVLSQR